MDVSTVAIVTTRVDETESYSLSTTLRITWRKWKKEIEDAKRNSGALNQWKYNDSNSNNLATRRAPSCGERRPSISMAISPAW